MDEHMLAAIDEACLGRSQGGISIGSVLVRDRKIIARGHNKRVQEKNPILHGDRVRRLPFIKNRSLPCKT